MDSWPALAVWRRGKSLVGVRSAPVQRRESTCMVERDGMGIGVGSGVLERGAGIETHVPGQVSGRKKMILLSKVDQVERWRLRRGPRGTGEDTWWRCVVGQLGRCATTLRRSTRPGPWGVNGAAVGVMLGGGSSPASRTSKNVSPRAWGAAAAVPVLFLSGWCMVSTVRDSRQQRTTAVARCAMVLRRLWQLVGGTELGAAGHDMKLEAQSPNEQEAPSTLDT